MWNQFSHLLDLSHGFQTETASRVTFNWSANCCWIWASSSSNNAYNSLSQSFSVVFHVLRFSRQNRHFEFFKPLKHCDLSRACSHTAHRKLRQVFDAILQQFSSNDNRKSMLSANRSFQAQNSTCSTLLQTILLYETYIVVSWKFLSDIRTRKWRQWRRLMTTTLTAMASYW